MKLDLKTDLHDESITRQGLGLSRHLANQTLQPFRCDDPGLGGEHRRVEVIDGVARHHRRDRIGPAARMDQRTDESSWIDPGLAKAGQLDRAVPLGETKAVGPDG